MFLKSCNVSISGIFQQQLRVKFNCFEKCCNKVRHRLVDSFPKRFTCNTSMPHPGIFLELSSKCMAREDSPDDLNVFYCGLCDGRAATATVRTDALR